MLIQFNAAPKRIELQKQAYFHLKDLFKSFQYLIWFSTFEQILGYNDGAYVLTFVDQESKKIIFARILSKPVVSVAKGNSNYVSKFQLSSSNSLEVMRIFVTEIDDKKGDRFHHLFVENLAPAEIARVQELSEKKFSKSKKRI